MSKKINFQVQEGDSFFSDEIAVIHNALKFYLDFKNTTPRVDIRFNDHQPMVLKHNVVIMDPYTAKELCTILSENIQNFEAKFGPIDKPEAQKKAEDIAKDQKPSVSMSDRPSYFG